MSEYRQPDMIGPGVGEPADGAPEPVGVRPPRWGGRRVIGPFTVRHIIVMNTVFVLSLAGLFAVSQPLGLPSSRGPADPQATFYRISSDRAGLEIGQLAPELVGTNNGQAVSLTDLDGLPVTLAALRGRPVWINFWATWCPPCQKELPDLRAASEAHRADGLVLVAISIQEVPDDVRAYARRYGLMYTIGLDVTGAIFRTYAGFGIPSHYFIDRNGAIRDRYFGPLDRAGMERYLAEILKP